MDQKILIIILGVLVIVNIGLLAGVLLSNSQVQCKFKKFPQNTRIVGGGKVSIHSHMFMAGIVIKQHAELEEDSLQCGCTIISAKWVVTAAHCLKLMEEQSFTTDLVYISSGHSQWRHGKKHDVANWIAHQHYDNDVMTNDIALILVKHSFTERPVTVANKRYVYKTNAYAMVTGWGFKQDNIQEVQEDLNGVLVKIIDQRQCTEWYEESRDTVTDEMFCAGFKEGGKDACQFDSGGPIFQKNLLIGIISWGVECARKRQPGVYTRITLYEKWITETTEKLGEPAHVVFKDRP